MEVQILLGLPKADNRVVMSKNYMPNVDSQEVRRAFGANFKKARAKKQLSQRDVFIRTGVAQSHISEVESGIANLTIDTMVKLSHLVKVPLWKLFKPLTQSSSQP